ncbi:MAG: hypothetical protein ABIL58_21125 [Pseudomonadota bacterium]
MNLSRREKGALAAAVAGIVGFLVMQLAVFPLTARHRQLKRVLAAKARTLTDMRVLEAETTALRQRVEATRRRIADGAKGDTLFAVLDQKAGLIALKDRIAYMKPSTIEDKESPYTLSTVEMKLQGISLAQLVQYLALVERTGDTVGVRRMSINRTSDAQRTIDAVLEFQMVGN